MLSRCRFACAAATRFIEPERTSPTANTPEGLFRTGAAPLPGWPVAARGSRRSAGRRSGKPSSSLAIPAQPAGVRVPAPMKAETAEPACRQLGWFPPSGGDADLRRGRRPRRPARRPSLRHCGTPSHPRITSSAGRRGRRHLAAMSGPRTISETSRSFPARYSAAGPPNSRRHHRDGCRGILFLRSLGGRGVDTGTRIMKSGQRSTPPVTAPVAMMTLCW